MYHSTKTNRNIYHITSKNYSAKKLYNTFMYAVMVTMSGDSTRTIVRERKLIEC